MNPSHLPLSPLLTFSNYLYVNLSKLWETVGEEEPDGLQFMGLQRVRHDLVIEQQQFCLGGRKLMELMRQRGKRNTTQTSCSGNQNSFPKSSSATRKYFPLPPVNNLFKAIIINNHRTHGFFFSLGKRTGTIYYFRNGPRGTLQK